MIFVWRVDKLYWLNLSVFNFVINIVGILWRVVYFLFFMVCKIEVGWNLIIGSIVVFIDMYVRIFSIYLK